MHKPYPTLRGRRIVSNRPSIQGIANECSSEKEIREVKKSWQNTIESMAKHSVKGAVTTTKEYDY